MVTTLYYSKAVLNDGAIGLWRLNGNALDSYPPNPHNGTVNDNVTFGAAGPVPDFDGINTTATFANSVNGISLPSGITTPIINPFSMEGWIFNDNNTAPPNYRVALCIKTGVTFFGIDSSKKILFACLLSGGQQLFSSNATLVTSTWTHVAVTWDGTNLRIYINGILDNTSSNFAGQTPTAFSSPLIGNEGNGNTARSWSGRLYGIALYNYALSTQQALNHFNLTTPVNATNTSFFTGASIPASVVYNPIPVLPPLGNQVTYGKPAGAQFIIALVDDDYGAGINNPTYDNSGNKTIPIINDPFYNPDESLGDGIRCDDDEDEDEDDDEWLCFDSLNRP
jgi:hypothetical protein